MANAERALTPAELLRILAKIDARGDRWKRKLRIVSVIGSWGVPNPAGIRELSEHAESSDHTTMGLLRELVEARIVLVVQKGGGSRPTTYVVNRDIHQWGTTGRGAVVAGGVPWLCSVPEAQLFAFHVAPPRDAGIHRVAAAARSRDTTVKARRGRCPQPRHKFWRR